MAVSVSHSVSELGLCLLEVLNGLEATVGSVLNDLLGLPVCSDDGPVADSHSWHLESEKVHIWLNSGLAHDIVASVEDAAVLEESTGEATEDDDLILSDLNDTGALTLSKLGRGDVDDDPGVGPVLRVVALD